MREIAFSLIVSTLAAVGCEGIERASLVGTGKVSKQGEVVPVYVVSSYHNNFMGYTRRTVHDELPDLNDVQAVRKAVEDVPPSHDLDGKLSDTIDAIGACVSQSTGEEVRIVVLSFDPPVFGYYPRKGSPPMDRPYIGPFATESMLDRHLIGYVVGDKNIFTSNLKREDMQRTSAHIVRRVEIPEKQTVQELLRTSSW